MLKNMVRAWLYAHASVVARFTTQAESCRSLMEMVRFFNLRMWVFKGVTGFPPLKLETWFEFHQIHPFRNLFLSPWILGLLFFVWKFGYCFISQTVKYTALMLGIFVVFFFRRCGVGTGIHRFRWCIHHRGRGGVLAFWLSLLPLTASIFSNKKSSTGWKPSRIIFGNDFFGEPNLAQGGWRNPWFLGSKKLRGSQFQLAGKLVVSPWNLRCESMFEVMYGMLYLVVT